MASPSDNGAVLTPFLTLPDPLESGEGLRDPLGLATLADHLAEWILPGVAAGMRRPRFLTAIAVSASVCEGLEEEIAAGKTPAWLVLEWLFVEAFARAGDKSDDFRKTPGIRKATTAREAGIALGSSNYLKAPTVSGFHGVYKRLARHVGIVDEDFQAQENGCRLLKVWEKEQRLQGQFTASVHNSGGHLRDKLRSAVEDGLQKGCTDRKDGWQGWSFFVKHLAPGNIGPDEAACLRRLLLDSKGEPRGELFRLITESNIFRQGIGDAALVDYLSPTVSMDLAARLRAIKEYEAVATPLDDCWDWLRYLSTQAGARALRRAEFAEMPEIRKTAHRLRERLHSAEQALKNAPRSVPVEFAQLACFFENVAGAESRYDALLERHAQVQKAKPPEGKRPWFERALDGSVIVRTPYRLTQRPQPSETWRRPYRLQAVLSFCRDLNRGQT